MVLNQSHTRIVHHLARAEDCLVAARSTPHAGRASVSVDAWTPFPVTPS